MQFSTLADFKIAPELRRQPFTLPCRLGRWKLQRLIGEGSLCQVYLGTPWYGTADLPDDFPGQAAIKVLRERWQNRCEALDMFSREAVAGQTVSHPNLISVWEARLEGPPYHLVMPYLQGMRLDALVARDGRLSLTAAARITGQVASAMDALFAAGWMHADVKPNNIMVSDAGDAVLIDLGFAQQIDELMGDENPPLFGTINYMAPERLISPPRLDVRGVVYSLGVTLYELLAGRLPFTGKTCGEVARAHRGKTPEDVRVHAPRVPQPLAELVGRMLAKRPEDRPQTPGQVARELQSLSLA
ncbi:MAG: serine/threonine protein kinase [Planctomycetales bacterium]